MSNRLSLLFIPLYSISVVSSFAQTPLAQTFAEIKSKDAAVSAEAERNVAVVFQQEISGIEKDTQLLCGSLHDANVLVRRHDAALLAAIVVAAPEHSKVDVACFPDLVAASDEADDTTRNNILYVLAMTPGGPPSEAREVFVKHLDSPNYRTSELAAAGLIRAGGERKQDNEMLVRAKLDHAPDAKQRLNLLYAIAGSGVQSEALLRSSKKFLADADPLVQSAAFQAVAATGTKAELARIMGDIVASPSASPQAKNMARMLLGGQEPPSADQNHGSNGSDR